jgi:hypothetical protein
MTQLEIFQKFGAIQITNVIPKEISNFLTHVMLRHSHAMKIQGVSLDDGQVQNTLTNMSNDIMFETIGERVWPFLENILGEELIPTYSYARLYQNGNILEKHIDRPACEISLSIQLGRSHHYSWPIYVGGQRFDLAECDAILYKGCEVEHWRNNCDGPEGYYSGQVFCHFVRATGPYAKYAGDERWDSEMPFTRFRTLVMETK